MEPTCWLCRRPASVLRYLHRPCQCTGAGIGLVHVACLDERIGESAKNRRCPMCRAAYPIELGPEGPPFGRVARELVAVATVCSVVQLGVVAVSYLFRYNLAGLSTVLWTALCAVHALELLLFPEVPRWAIAASRLACIIAALVLAPASSPATATRAWMCAVVVYGGLHFARIAFRGKWPAGAGRVRLRRLGSGNKQS